MDTWLELAKGPIFQFAFLFMVLGLLRHLIVAIIGVVQTLRRSQFKTMPYKAIIQDTIKWLVPIGKLKGNPLFRGSSVVMHIGMILVPIFLFSHVALWEKGIGFGWPSMGLLMSDILTLLTIVALFVLLAIRIISRDGRMLSRFEDYFLLILLAVPFISGYLALHPAFNPFDYKATMLVHILSADLIFILMPITKLSHVVLMPGSQLVSEAAWHFPKDSGKNVAIALHKEEEPI